MFRSFSTTAVSSMDRNRTWSGALKSSRLCSLEKFVTCAVGSAARLTVRQPQCVIRQRFLMDFNFNLFYRVSSVCKDKIMTCCSEVLFINAYFLLFMKQESRKRRENKLKRNGIFKNLQKLSLFDKNTTAIFLSSKKVPSHINFQCFY